MGARLAQVPALNKRALLVPATILASGGLAHAFYVAFFLNMSFWQMLQTSSHNHEAGATLHIGGESYDLPADAVPASLQGSFHGPARELQTQVEKHSDDQFSEKV